MRHSKAALAATLIGACAPVPVMSDASTTGAPSLFEVETAQRWRLPPELREISGLAVDPADRLFAHEDESAIIYEIDVANGRPMAHFSLGAPAETGDFEGLAITPSGDFYMITSQGTLYKFHEGQDGTQVTFERIDTGLGALCEVEGLAYFAAEKSLIVACKRNIDRAQRADLSLHLWGLDSSHATPWLTVAEETLAAAAGVKRFRPSSVEIDPRTGRVLLLSANRGAFAEFGPDGNLLAARALDSVHTQAEGLAVLRDGSLIVADEGGDGQALLSRYRRSPD